MTAVASDFGVSYNKIYYHCKNEHHLRGIQPDPEGDLADARAIYREIALWHKEAKDLYKEAKESGNGGLALKGLDKALKCLELLARIQGQIQDVTQINVLVNPQWVSLRTTIIEALEPYPEAREAVIHAIQ
jgi:hypothetical protein